MFRYQKVYGIYKEKILNGSIKGGSLLPSENTLANEFDVEGIINSSSQFHWEGGKGWNAFHPVEWIREYIEYYKKVYPNLLLHDKNYPSPEYLLSKWKVGNIKGDGEYRERTEGAQFIAKVLSMKWKQ